MIDSEFSQPPRLQPTSTAGLLTPSPFNLLRATSGVTRSHVILEPSSLAFWWKIRVLSFGASIGLNGDGIRQIFILLSFHFLYSSIGARTRFLHCTNVFPSSFFLVLPRLDILNFATLLVVFFDSLIGKLAALESKMCFCFIVVPKSALSTQHSRALFGNLS